MCKACCVLPDPPLPLFHTSFSSTSTLPQARTTAFRAYSEAESGVLFSTDVAARGLDLPEVEWIFQYDAPTNVTEYVHRTGRTARLGAQGSALLFLLPSEVAYLDVLARNAVFAAEKSLGSVLTPLRGTDRKASVEKSAIALQTAIESHIAKDEGRAENARLAFLSWVRAYATHPKSAKHIFHIRNLHLGHLCKAFGLQTPPTQMRAKKGPKEAGDPLVGGGAGGGLPRRKTLNSIHTEWGDGFDGDSGSGDGGGYGSRDRRGGGGRGGGRGWRNQGGAHSNRLSRSRDGHAQRKRKNPTSFKASARKRVKREVDNRPIGPQ